MKASFSELQGARPVLLSARARSARDEVARAIHDCGQPARERWVVIDTLAYPSIVLDLQLFGASAGPNGREARPGALERPDFTVFVTDATLLSEFTQHSLTGVIRRGEVRRIGEHTLRAARARLVLGLTASPVFCVQKGRLDGALADAIALRVQVP